MTLKAALSRWCPSSLRSADRYATADGDRFALNGRRRLQDRATAIGTAGRVLLVMDVDGGEKELLNAANCARLVEIDMVAGVHDRIVPGATESLQGRLAESHAVAHIPQMSRSVADIPEGLRTGPELMCLAMDECRGDGNDWLWMKAKSPSS